MNKKDITLKLENKISDEIDIINNFRIRKHITDENYRDIARDLFLLGRDSIQEHRGNWCNHIYGTSLIKTLLQYPVADVTITPYKNEEEFNRRYGVTIEQMRILSENGAITLDFQSLPPKHKIIFNEYANSPNIIELINSKHFGIHSLRFGKLTKAILENMPPSSENRSLDLSHRFSRAIHSMSNSDRVDYFMKDDPRRALDALNGMYNYLRIFYPKFNVIDDQINKYRKLEDRIQQAKLISALKLSYISPLSLSMGGISQINACQLNLLSINKRLTGASLDREFAISNSNNATIFFNRLREKSFGNNSNDTLPCILTKDEFGQFLKWRTNGICDSICRIINSMQTESENKYYKIIDSLKDLEKVISDYKKESKYLPSVARLISQAILAYLFIPVVNTIDLDKTYSNPISAISIVLTMQNLISSTYLQDIICSMLDRLWIKGFKQFPNSLSGILTYYEDMQHKGF